MMGRLTPLGLVEGAERQHASASLTTAMAPTASAACTRHCAHHDAYSVTLLVLPAELGPIRDEGAKGPDDIVTLFSVLLASSVITFPVYGAR